MKWRKPPAELVDLFLSLVPDDPEVDVRAMFGTPCFFCHGNMGRRRASASEAAGGVTSRPASG